MAQNEPTVNGLFYGDGDYSKYSLYAISENGSKLYVSYVNSRLYVALVVSRNVNDNVFSSKSNKSYVQIVHAAFPDGVSDFCQEFQGAPEGTTTLRVPRNNSKAFFKLVEVE